VADDVGLVIPITADTNPFRTAMNVIQTSVSASTEGVRSSLANVKASFGAVGVMAAGYLEGAIKNASEAQKANSNLETTIKSTGGAAGITAKQAEDMALGFSKVSLQGGNAIKSGEAMLLTFTNIGKDVFPMATQAMLDLSQKMGTDPTQAAMQLGKALNDPIKGVGALSRVGVTFSASQKEVIASLVKTGDVAGAQKIILGELNNEFGGQALAATKTYDGQIQMMTKSLGGIKTSIGTAVLPYLQMMVEGIQKVINPIADFIKTNSKLAAVILSLTAGFGTFVGGASLVQKIMGVLGPVVKGAAVALEGMVLPVAAIIAIIALLGVAYAKNFGGMKTAVDGFIAGSMKVLQQIMADVQAWVVANWPTIQATFLAVFNAIKGFWNSVLKPIFLDLLVIVGQVVDWVKANWPAIEATFKVVFDAIKGYWDTVLKPVLLFITQELGVIVAWVKANWPLISDTIKIVFDAVKSVVETIIGVVFVIIQTVCGYIMDFWKDHWTTISSVLKSTWDIIKTIVDTVIHVVLDLISAVMLVINGKWGEAWQKVCDAVKRIFSGAIKIIQDIIHSIAAIFADVINSALGWGEHMIQGFIDGILSKIGAVKDAVSQVMKAAAKLIGFKSPSEEGEGRHIVEWGAGMINGFSDGIKSKIPDLKNLMASVITAPDLNAKVKLTGSALASIASGGSVSGGSKVTNQYSVTVVNKGTLVGSGGMKEFSDMMSRSMGSKFGLSTGGSF